MLPLPPHRNGTISVFEAKLEEGARSIAWDNSTGEPDCLKDGIHLFVQCILDWFCKSYFASFDILCIVMSPFDQPPPPVPGSVLLFLHGRVSCCFCLWTSFPAAFCAFLFQLSRPLANPTRSTLSALPLPVKAHPYRFCRSQEQKKRRATLPPFAHIVVSLVDPKTKWRKEEQKNTAA